MVKIPTKEEYYTAYEKFTQGLKDAFESPDVVENIESICRRNHLDYDRTNAVISLFGNMLLGFTHPEDLARCISELTKIDIRVSETIAKEIKAKILPIVASDLIGLYGYHIDGLPNVVTTHIVSPLVQPENAIQEGHPPISPVAKEITNMLVSKTKNEVLKPEVESPFILHAHPKPEQNLPTTKGGYNGDLVRPTFYTPPGGDVSGDEIPRARLEIGTPDIQEEPQTARVGKESARVVHYSTPEAPADPFSSAQSTPQTKPAVDKKDVPPSNVVNLKDLPQ